MMETNEKEYVLWLPSWYPNKLGPFDGDFVQRQAEAVSAFHPIHVICLIKDEKKTLTNSILVEEKITGNLKETIIYYAVTDYPIKKLSQAATILKYGHIYRKFLRNYFRSNGIPFLVHVHITFKAGLIARWIKRYFGIPFILTEHWTIFLQEAQPNFNKLTFAKQYLISKILLDASMLITVSHHLGKAIQQRWPYLEYEVIPNVVDHRIFFPGEKNPSGKLKLIHASSLNYQKDPESMLRAAGLLKLAGIDFSLDICGPPRSDVNSLIKSENLEDRVILHGEIQQAQLADIIRTSDALILYSRFETFGCVVIEANACGIPAIVTNNNVMHELVLNGVNGIFVPPDDPNALAEKILTFLETRENFDRNVIAKTTKQYSYTEVGQQHSAIYSRLREEIN